MITSLFFASEKENEKDHKKTLEREINFHGLSLLILLVVGFVGMYFFGYELYISTIILTLLIIKLNTIIRISDKIRGAAEEERKFMDRIMLIFFFVILIGLSFTYGWKEADKVKAKNGFLIYKEIEFNFKDKFYSTVDSTDLTFVGETSDNLFLYDTTENKSLIFYKNRLNNVIKIHDPTILTEEEEEEEEEVKEMENKIQNLFGDSTNKK